MKKNGLVLVFALILVAFAAHSQSVWNRVHLSEVKNKIESPYYAKTYESLLRQADSLLDVAPLSVMMKDKVPASGDKHDYMSQARYFWPDETKPNGLPYVNRDGVTNPEINRLDRIPLGITADRIKTLALAWYMSGNEKYAAKATELIRAWFLDRNTAMNPNLEFAQVAPGHHNDKGRSYGLIDTYSFVDMLDGVKLLETSRSFTKKDQKALRKWFADLTRWMQQSGQGKEEGNAANNHSVAYDAQIIAFSLYGGDNKTAGEVIAAIPEKRIFMQIAPDGSQPHELTRTLALHYSCYNLEHFLDIMSMAKKLGVDLGNAKSADGRSIYKALDYLAQYAGKPQSECGIRQISGWAGAQQNLYKNLYRASQILADSELPEDQARSREYRKIYNKYRILDRNDMFNLVNYEANDIDDAFAFAEDQFIVADRDADQARKTEDNAKHRRFTPRSINPDGSLVMVHPYDWCSGFFGGSLWQFYEYTNRTEDRIRAISWTWPIEEAKWHKGTHDLGFMMNDSFGKGYKLTGEQSYRDVVLQSARTLITRYSPVVKSIRSWDHNRDKWAYPVIIDNLMNLEMLFDAYLLTGDTIFKEVAVNHANTTMKNHFRDDYSSYHVVDYDPETGAVRGRFTHQGYADDSFWSRGQGWGIYGYAMCYRYTGDEKYLRQSEGIADFILSLPNMPADMIPYWDMKMPEVNGCTPDKVNPDVPRDASSAAVIASGLYELSDYVDSGKSSKYLEAADRILDSLNRYYRAERGGDHGFLLLHSVGHHPGGSEIDVPINYADYYYLEALSRKRARLR